MIKSLVLAAALLGVPAVASAQAAAGAIPNAFDRPAGSPAAQAASQATATQAPPSLPPATQPVSDKSEDALRDVIEGAQGDGIDYALMTDTLAEQVRAQEATVTPLIQGFGAIQALDFVGAQDGADIYAVTFASAETLWVIGFDDAGKIDALLFRPAPAEAPAVAPTPAPAPSDD